MFEGPSDGLLVEKTRELINNNIAMGPLQFIWRMDGGVRGLLSSNLRGGENAISYPTFDLQSVILIKMFEDGTG